MKILRLLSWLLRAVLFLLLLMFAHLNTAPVSLKFYFDRSWEIPLVVLLLAFAVFGSALGVMACMGRLFRQRRELAALRRRVARFEKAEAAAEAAATNVQAPPPADAAG